MDDEEWLEMRQHPAVTGKILVPFSSLNHICPWALYHHEQYEGKGYPEGLKGESIPIEAKVLARADAFDAMTSDRPYRLDMNMMKTTEELNKYHDQQWRSDVVDAFLKGVDRGSIIIEKT